MEFCDILISTRLNRYFNRILSLAPDTTCFVGARPGSQSMDIVHTLQTVVEKALDLRSDGAIGQMDIQQYYDHLSIGLLWDWMIEQNIDAATIAAATCREAAQTRRRDAIWVRRS